MTNIKTLTLDSTGERLEIVKDYTGNMMTDRGIEPLLCLCVRPTPIPLKEKNLEYDVEAEVKKATCDGNQWLDAETMAICRVLDRRLAAIEEKIK